MDRSGRSCILLIALALAGCGGPVESGARPPGEEAAATSRELTIPAGTVVIVRLNTALNSGVSEIGDVFTAEVAPPVMVNGRTALPDGSQVSGKVAAVKAARRGAGHGEMTLDFSGIKLPGGAYRSLSARLSEATDGTRRRNAGSAGGSAAGGGGDDAEGAVVGAVVGGAFGTGAVLAQEGRQVNLPAGTRLVVRLDRPLCVPELPPPR